MAIVAPDSRFCNAPLDALARLANTIAPGQSLPVVAFDPPRRANRMPSRSWTDRCAPPSKTRGSWSARRRSDPTNALRLRCNFVEETASVVRRHRILVNQIDDLSPGAPAQPGKCRIGD